MAFADLTITGALWRPLGLCHLLWEKPVAELPQEKFAPSRQQPAARSQSESAGSCNSHNYFERQAPRQSPCSAASPRPGQSAVSCPLQFPAVPLQTARPAAWRSVPAAQWPENWKKRLGATKKGRIAWTYWNLGFDLEAVACGKEEAAKRKCRGEFLRSIFQDLGYPAGTHTLWPVCLPDDDGNANPDIFWSGGRELGFRGVVIMGSAAARPLLQRQGLKPLTQLRHAGQSVWILWEIDHLATAPEIYQRALVFLRPALRNFLQR